MQNIPSPTPEINPPTRKPEFGVVADDLPFGFNPAAFPILAEHWFGISPAGVGVDTVATAA